MAGGAKSSQSGRELAASVKAVAESLGLDVRSEVKVGRRLWGSVRRIDLVLSDPRTRRSLGIECKFQRTPGTAEEKTPATIQDIQAWPIDGLLVIDGPGFSANMKGYLYSTGKVVALEDLEGWLRLYFGLPGK